MIDRQGRGLLPIPSFHHLAPPPHHLGVERRDGGIFGFGLRRQRRLGLPGRLQVGLHQAEGLINQWCVVERWIVGLLACLGGGHAWDDGGVVVCCGWIVGVCLFVWGVAMRGMVGASSDCAP